MCCLKVQVCRFQHRCLEKTKLPDSDLPAGCRCQAAEAVSLADWQIVTRSGWKVGGFTLEAVEAARKRRDGAPPPPTPHPEPRPLPKPHHTAASAPRGEFRGEKREGWAGGERGKVCLNGCCDTCGSLGRSAAGSLMKAAAPKHFVIKAAEMHQLKTERAHTQPWRGGGAGEGGGVADGSRCASLKGDEDCESATPLTAFRRCEMEIGIGKK